MAWMKDRDLIGLKAIWWAAVIAAGCLFFLADSKAQVGFGISLGCIGGAIWFALEERS